MQPSIAAATDRTFDHDVSHPVTKEDLLSISVGARQDIIMELASRLEDVALIASQRARDDLEAMLAYLSSSFRTSAAEIATESYGPLLIEQMSASVCRIEQGFFEAPAGIVPLATHARS